MIGETVSHYRIVSKLGRGGMGVVYLAEDTHLGRQVAIKFSTTPPDHELYRSRFLREARAASALNHPHIARIYDYGESETGQPFLVMELIKGHDLAQILIRTGVSILQALRIAEEAGEALAEAHRNSIIHRDIKPSNIVIDERGQVKVLDFGLAKLFQNPRDTNAESPTIESSQTAAGTVLGTPSYMSPEQAKEAQLGPPSDLFALGAVLYECLAGRPAFTGANSVEILAGVLHLEPAPPSQFNPRVSPELDRIVAKALAKDPAARYQSAPDLLADLRAVRTGMVANDKETEILAFPGVPANSRPPTGLLSLQGLTGQLRRSKKAAAVTLVVFVAMVAGGVWLFSPASYESTPEAQGWYQQGLAAIRDGTYYKASKALEQAVKSDPNFAMAHARLAEAYSELDLNSTARAEMLRAMPPGTSPKLNRAERTYMQALQFTLTGDFAAAANTYRQLEQRSPTGEQANALVDLGRAYEKSEKTKEAVEAYAEATRRQSQNPAGWLRLAILYGRQLKHAEAAQAFSRAEQLYRSLSNLEGLTEVLYQRAVYANRLNSFADAKTLLTQALELARVTGSLSQQILARLQLSAAEYRSTDYGQAQTDAAEALEMARTNGLENVTTRGLVDLGNAYFLKGDAEEARKLYSQSLDYARRYHSEHNEARALFSLGNLDMRYGDLGGGMQYLGQALKFFERGGYQREAAQTLVLLARAQRQKGDYTAALQSFDQQLKLGAKSEDASQISLAQQGRGSVLLAQGKLPESLNAYRAAYDAAVKSGDKLNAQYGILNTADIHWRLGRYDEARKELTDAGPTNARAPADFADAIRAFSALSQRDYRGAAEIATRMLAQPGLTQDLAVEAKTILGRARLATGDKNGGLAAVAEGAQLAEKSGNALVIADARLALAEALLAGGDAKGAIARAESARNWYDSVGNREAQWRAMAVVAAADKALKLPSTQADAAQAVQVLASLQQTWDSESYKTYISRPDIRAYRDALN